MRSTTTPSLPTLDLSMFDNTTSLSLQKCYKDICDLISLNWFLLIPPSVKIAATLGGTLDLISSNKVYALDKEHH